MDNSTGYLRKPSGISFERYARVSRASNTPTFCSSPINLGKHLLGRIRSLKIHKYTQKRFNAKKKGRLSLYRDYNQVSVLMDIVEKKSLAMR